MTAEVKVIAFLISAAIMLGGIYFGFRSVYGAGDRNGAARIQVQWDVDKAKDATLASTALIKVTQERDAALTANEGIINDTQQQIDSLRSLNGDLAHRLRLATATPASGGSLPKAGADPSPATAPSNSRLGLLNDALAATLTECAVNRANYSALIAELKPQL